MPTRSQVPKAATALLLVDVVNPLDFPGGVALARRSLRMAARLAALLCAGTARRGVGPAPRTVIVTGFMADNCVLFTAADDSMRDCKIAVPRDCVTAKTRTQPRRALKTVRELFGARTTPSSRLRLSRR